MSKHTPGPWTVGKVDPPSKYGDWDDAGGYRIDADGVEQLCYVWNASQRMPLSGVQSDGPPFGSESGEANARLIAAAPDLLEALIRCVSEVRREAEHIEYAARNFGGYDEGPEPPLEYTRLMAVANLAEAAVAKARGDA